MRRSTAVRLTRSIALVAMVGAGACQPAEPEQPPPPVEPAPASTPAVPAVAYGCEGGATVEARYIDSATAQLVYQDRTYDLRAVQAPSGARYVGSGVEWRTSARDGQEDATLSRLGPDETAATTVVLERCSRPAPGPAPSVSAEAPVAVEGAAPCKAPQLKLAAENGDAGAGNRVRNFSLQNIGRQACSLTGYPDIALLDSQSRPLSGIRAEQSPGSYFRDGEAPRPVELAPRAKAYFELAWSVVPDETMQKTCPAAATLRATALGDTAAVSLPFALEPCGGKVRVSPIRAKADPQPGT